MKVLIEKKTKQENKNDKLTCGIVILKITNQSNLDDIRCNFFSQFKNIQFFSNKSILFIFPFLMAFHLQYYCDILKLGKISPSIKYYRSEPYWVSYIQYPFFYERDSFFYKKLNTEPQLTDDFYSLIEKTYKKLLPYFQFKQPYKTKTKINSLINYFYLKYIKSELKKNIFYESRKKMALISFVSNYRKIFQRK